MLAHTNFLSLHGNKDVKSACKQNEVPVRLFLLPCLTWKQSTALGCNVSSICTIACLLYKMSQETSQPGHTCQPPQPSSPHSTLIRAKGFTVVLTCVLGFSILAQDLAARPSVPVQARLLIHLGQKA